MAELNIWLIGSGVVAFVIGWLMRSWAARHNLIDVATDAALSTAWKTATTRQMPGMPEEITSRMSDITGEASHVGKAKKVAGYAARHAVATVVGLVGLVLLVVGVLLAGVGLFWR